jgi:hypothetical protein
MCYNAFMKSLNHQIDPELVSALAETVRKACLQAALAGYEDAAANGLCAEGAWEAAVSAIQNLRLEQLVQTALADQNSKR